jgi:hypothetical protein
MKIVRAALIAAASATIAGAGVLALSYVTLKGTADPRPLTGLAVFAGLSAVIAVSVVSGFNWTSAVALICAGAANAWFGWTAIAGTLASSHFEGYALVMGALAIIQGVVAVALSGWRLWAPGLAAPHP